MNLEIKWYFLNFSLGGDGSKCSKYFLKLEASCFVCKP